MANRYEVEIGGRFSALLEERQPQELYDNFKRIIHSVAKQEIGLKQHKQLDNLSCEVINLCERRRKAKINLLNHPDDAEKQIEYRKLNKTVKTLIQKQKRENLQNKIMTLEEDFAKNNTHNLFRSVRELEGKKQKSCMVLKDSQGVIRMKKQEVLTIWQTHFEKHLNTQFPHDEDSLSELDSDMNVEEFPPITQTEVANAVKQLKNLKSPGIDGITAELIKSGGTMMVKILVKLFNQVIESEVPPRDWSRMMVTPIHKKGDKMDPNNYRAIALLSIPGKVFCRILMDRSSDIIERSLSESQHGFRPNRGTTDAIFIARQIIEKAREHQVPIHFHFIDFKAAFDTIWREALWKMLLKTGVPSKIVTLIKTYTTLSAQS